MATKIRLQRGGRKNYAFYSIVIADARAPRDGKKKVTDAKKAAAAQNLEAEKKVNEAIAKKVADKKAATVAAQAEAEAAQAAEDTTSEAPAEEAPAEA